ncbi:MAG TPA: LysM peptidoglycan-binding domain-containing protein [Chloroflexi bacterium]|nr:LysM peptidoglycan-binding domain-containing protein [Chloroflexota bacterium]
MTRKRSWLVALTLFTLFSLCVGALDTEKALAQGGPNLLRNGDFEEGQAGQAWPFQDGIPEVQVAPGWRAFWLDDPPPYVAPPPDYCHGDPRCAWGRPEFRGTAAYEYPNRVHSGQFSQKYFSYNRQHEAGLYQQVSGIQPGTRLRFSVWIQTWSCMPKSSEEWNVCPAGDRSYNPAPMHIWVGIDPTGGTNWAASTVVRSPEREAYDEWTLFEVEATAESDTVTVFIHTRADWYDQIPRINNDVYIDDASLVPVTPPTSTPPPPPPTPTPGPSPTPRATPTPRPDGAIVHVVQPGDTLYSIALQYGVSVEQIQELNAGSLGPNNLIYVGQELVIAIPSATPTPSPGPTTPTPSTSPTPEAGSICVLAFHDRNGDGLRQEDTEELLPNALFSLSDAVGVVGQYTTDGLNEPYCFAGLAAGTYTLLMDPPAGYTASGPSTVMVALPGPISVNVAMGAQRGEAPVEDTATPTGTETPAEEEPTEGPSASPSFLQRALQWGAQASGVLLLILAVALVVFFVLSRRRR